MVLVQPAGFQHGATRLSVALWSSNKNFLQFSEAFWEIGEDFGGNFALIASRTKDARHQDPSWSFGAQWRFEDFDAKPAAAQADTATES